MVCAVVSLCVCSYCPDWAAALDCPVLADNKMIADSRPSLILMPLVDLLCRCVDVRLSCVVNDNHVRFRALGQIAKAQIRFLDFNFLHYVFLLSLSYRMTGSIC